MQHSLRFSRIQFVFCLFQSYHFKRRGWRLRPFRLTIRTGTPTMKMLSSSENKRNNSARCVCLYRGKHETECRVTRPLSHDVFRAGAEAPAGEGLLPMKECTRAGKERKKEPTTRTPFLNHIEPPAFVHKEHSCFETSL